MSFAGDGELVLPMPPLSMRRIEMLADALLDVLSPRRSGPTGLAVDVVDLIERILPEHGIDVYPVSPGELGRRFGATRADGRRTLIRLRDDLFDAIIFGGRSANLGRGTIFHEAGHATLHVEILRQWERRSPEAVELNRAPRRTLPAFEDPEWQAWAIGGCLAAPRRLLVPLLPATTRTLAREFGVSEVFMRRHLKRLHLDDQLFDTRELLGSVL